MKIKSTIYSAGIHQPKVNNINTRTRCEICSNLTIKIPINFEHILHFALGFLLLTLNMQLPDGHDFSCDQSNTNLIAVIPREINQLILKRY